LGRAQKKVLQIKCGSGQSRKEDLDNGWSTEFRIGEKEGRGPVSKNKERPMDAFKLWGGENRGEDEESGKSDPLLAEKKEEQRVKGL